MTAAEYFDMPVGPPYFQLIDGELFMSPSPAHYHQRLVFRFAHLLQVYLDAHPLGELTISPSDVHFDEGNVFQPDFYYITNERLHILGRQGPKGAPDLVAEVLSPSTSRLDLVPKKMVYAQAGVQEYWVVRPSRHVVEVYRFQENPTEPVSVLDRDGILSSPLFPEWTLPLASVFGE